MPETTFTIHNFFTPQELAENLAEEVAKSLADAISVGGRASLIVSGGSTPKPFFQHLSLKKIDWEKVIITLADERWVDTSSPDSNEYLVRSLLLQNAAARATFIGLKTLSSSASEGQKQFNKNIENIPHPFDIVILGMGNDGHTASLFPGAKRLPEAVSMQSENYCIAITPPSAPHERLTLTLATLLDSREIILHITGEMKKKVLDKALGEGVAEDMPIRYILRQQKTPVRIYWAP